jgi:hypothetical protein
MTAGIMATMNEHDLALAFRVKTTEQLGHVLDGLARLEKKLGDWEETGCPFGKVNRARLDAAGDKGFFGKIIGLLVAAAGGIFGRKG